MKTISDVESDLKDAVEREMGDLLDCGHSCRSDQLTEIAEGEVPNSDRELTEVFISFPSLSRRTEVTSDTMDVFEILRANLSESLRNTANEIFEELERDFDTLKNEFESAGFDVGYDTTARKYTIIVTQDDAEAPEVVHTGERFKSEYDAIKWWEKQGETKDGTNSNAG